jgi:hypothetical protein
LGNAYNFFLPINSHHIQEEGAAGGTSTKERGITGGWPEIHNKELHDSYYTTNTVRSKFVKNEHAQYKLEYFSIDNARIIYTKSLRRKK